MVVYVDNMYAKYGNMRMCHMMADTEKELHEMADKIGVDRRWFQVVPSGNHYDIAMSRRAFAVQSGAVQISVREMAAYAWYRRVHGCFVEPTTALALYREHLAARHGKAA